MPPARIIPLCIPREAGKFLSPLEFGNYTAAQWHLHQRYENKKGESHDVHLTWEDRQFVHFIHRTLRRQLCATEAGKAWRETCLLFDDDRRLRSRVVGNLVTPAPEEPRTPHATRVKPGVRAASAGNLPSPRSSGLTRELHTPICNKSEDSETDAGSFPSLSMQPQRQRRPRPSIQEDSDTDASEDSLPPRPITSHSRRPRALSNDAGSSFGGEDWNRNDDQSTVSRKTSTTDTTWHGVNKNFTKRVFDLVDADDKTTRERVVKKDPCSLEPARRGRQDPAVDGV